MNIYAKTYLAYVGFICNADARRLNHCLQTDADSISVHELASIYEQRQHEIEATPSAKAIFAAPLNR